MEADKKLRRKFKSGEIDERTYYHEYLELLKEARTFLEGRLTVGRDPYVYALHSCLGVLYDAYVFISANYEQILGLEKLFDEGFKNIDERLEDLEKRVKRLEEYLLPTD